MSEVDSKVGVKKKFLLTLLETLRVEKPKTAPLLLPSELEERRRRER